MKGIEYKLLTTLMNIAQTTGRDIGLQLDKKVMCQSWKCSWKEIKASFKEISKFIYGIEEIHGFCFVDINLDKFFEFGYENKWFKKGEEPKINECYEGEYIKDIANMIYKEEKL